MQIAYKCTVGNDGQPLLFIAGLVELAIVTRKLIMTDAKLEPAKTAKPVSTKPTIAKKEIIMDKKSSAIESLIENHEIATKALADARQRRIRFTTALIEDTVNTQSRTLELTKAISEKPTAYKDNITATLESLAKSQAQSMDLFKLMIIEQADMREEFIATTKALIEGSQGASKAAMAAAKSWSTDNAFSGIVKKSIDTMKETAEKMTTN